MLRNGRKHAQIVEHIHFFTIAICAMKMRIFSRLSRIRQWRKVALRTGVQNFEEITAMDFDLKDKPALILAGTRGLGLACAHALVAEGARVVINGRNSERGQAALQGLGKRAVFITADITNKDDRARLHQLTVDAIGSPTILVTNGAGPTADLFLDTPLQAWDEAFGLMLTPAIDMALRCVPAMLDQGWGRVINLSSISGKEISLLGSRANSLRPALVGAFGTLAREVAATGVTVNSILSGPYDTPGMRKVVRQHSGRTDLSEDEAVAAYAAHGPMKRLGDTSELGALCAFLASAPAGYITGQAITIDGGRVPTIY
ncbi:MAG: SDR family oxidoreductase [Hyphomicrobiaceae bacterium]